MARNRLTSELLEKELQTLEGWSLQDDKLYQRFSFDTFVAAFGFMTQVALLAESLDHHPEWSNVYATVNIHLITHDSGGITDLDIALAREINALLQT